MNRCLRQSGRAAFCALRSTAFGWLLVAAVLPVLSAEYPAPAVGDFVLKDFRFTSGETLPELRIHYRTIGAPARNLQGLVTNAVLVLHGTTGNGSNFLRAEFAGELFGKGQLLDATRYFIVLPDGIGHGQSSKPECCYTRLNFAYDIKLLLDKLGVAKADVVGHSLGSIIAQTFAEYWPERTRRVVLISSTGGWPPGRPRKTAQFDYAAEIRKLKEPIDADSPFMVAWWDSPTPVDPDFIRRQRKDAAGIPLRVWLAVLDQGLAADAYADLQATLPRLKAPTLLIWGSKDPIMEPEVRQSLRDALPDAQVKVFEGLGHNPFWEDPRGVAGVINSFLDPQP